MLRRPSLSPDQEPQSITLLKLVFLRCISSLTIVTVSYLRELRKVRSWVWFFVRLRFDLFTNAIDWNSWGGWQWNDQLRRLEVCAKSWNKHRVLTNLDGPTEIIYFNTYTVKKQFCHQLYKLKSLDGPTKRVESVMVSSNSLVHEDDLASQSNKLFRKSLAYPSRSEEVEIS